LLCLELPLEVADSVEELLLLRIASAAGVLSEGFSSRTTSMFFGLLSGRTLE